MRLRSDGALYGPSKILSRENLLHVVNSPFILFQFRMHLFGITRFRFGKRWWLHLNLIILRNRECLGLVSVGIMKICDFQPIGYKQCIVWCDTNVLDFHDKIKHHGRFWSTLNYYGTHLKWIPMKSVYSISSFSVPCNAYTYISFIT